MESSSGISLFSIALAVIMLGAVLIMLYHILKGMLKIAAMIAAIVILYLGYLAFTGQGMPKDAGDLIKQIKERSSSICESAEQILGKTKVK